ncbi:hypothetical protein COV19_06825 [Candidatus Woesearchaeota archaeon CG10_big_fil_rev_8_21_14_0_10_44_13]|nr:MAG: hypothetical protein COV19_06825 [Candidatus Woesearchaeota archaeon CG10_big_fil_rev_8_21_14_0_10_44_13]
MDEMRVKCRQCGRYAKTNEFVLDHGYKMMVCPACVKDRKLREDVHREVDAQRQAKKKEGMEEVAEKSAGWDKEDEYLNKLHAAKMKNTVKVEYVTDDKVKYTCAKCSYKFIYDMTRKMPPGCPYCGTGIMKMTF